MKFEAVHLPTWRELDRKASQTFLRHYDGCPRSGYLYQAFKGDAQTDAMVAGSAGHAAIERCILACIDTGEVTIPPELAKAIVDEVLGEYHVPLSRHDYLREAVYRWASETAIDPSAVIAAETMLVLEVEGWQVRMRVDYATLLEDGAAVAVEDFKFGRGMPTQEEVARKRTTPLAGGGAAAALMGKSFQLILYALGLRYGRPVRVEECTLCGGAGGWGVAGGSCSDCEGRGTLEIVEPFALAPQAGRFDLSYVFPGVEDREGKMGRRYMSVTATELDAYLQSLRSLVKRVEESERTGDWPAQISDEACSQCPAPLECPIPSQLRDLAGRVNSTDDAAEAAEHLDREKAVHAARQRELKAFAKANGGQIRFGRDKLQEFVVTTSETIRDKEALRVAVERAVQFGDPFEWDDHVKVSTGTAFKVRTLTADELAAEAEGEPHDG